METSAFSLLTCSGIIDGDGRALSGADAILVGGAVIVAVGNRRELAECRPEAAVINLTGTYAMPGLINAHDHVLFRRSRLALADHFGLAPEVQRTYAAAAAARSLAEGVTATRDMGAPGEPGRYSARCSVPDGGGRVLAGPREVSCVKALTVPGGPGLALSLQVETEEDVCEAVGWLADRGAAFIKVFASTDGSAPSQPTLPDSMLRAACAAARRRDLLVAAHATTRQSVRACIAAGVRCIEHGVGIDAAAAREMARSGIWLVPTLSGFRVIADHGAAWGRPEHVVAYFASVLSTHRRALEFCLEAGVLLAVGTDSLGTMAMEMSLMMDCGASASQVIRAATLHGAQLLGLGGGAGCLASGSPADILLVRDNPLEDLATLGEPAAVVRNGVLHDGSALRILFPDP